ncbi:MAG: hypothetical protein H3C48_19270 [Chitinophagaceae bacterium]|nr:hypothetical protein [Chitinophagaceae bacterium]
MKHNKVGVMIGIVLILVSLSCQLTSPQAPSQPTLPPLETPTQVVEAPPTPTEDTSATQAAEQAERATQQAEQAIKEAAAATEAANAAEAAAATQEADAFMKQTAEVEAQATAQAQGMADAVQSLVQQGVLNSSSGTYYWMEDFTQSWAQIGWYQWWSTGLAPTNFVIRAHTEWESGSRTANWYESGCGFVFREEDEDNHYMIFLALDGNVYLKGYVDGKYREFGKGYYGKVDFAKGSADVMLAVEGDNITYFVNGEKVLQRKNNELKSGDLALTLMSGTNKDFGTRCRMSDIEIWDLTSQ